MLAHFGISVSHIREEWDHDLLKESMRHYLTTKLSKNLKKISGKMQVYSELLEEEKEELDYFEGLIQIYS